MRVLHLALCIVGAALAAPAGGGGPGEKHKIAHHAAKKDPDRMVTSPLQMYLPRNHSKASHTSPRRKVALVTGITGQDGSYLAELLLERGYEVHGIRRRASSFNSQRIRDSASWLFLHYGDLADSASCMQIVQQIRPGEIYNLAAQSHVKTSFETSEYTADVDALGTLRLLNAMLNAGLEKKTRFYQASTSELFGAVREVPQKETTPFYPRSPYGVCHIAHRVSVHAARSCC